MIIPCIDLMNSEAVQLVGGKEIAIEAGNPFPIAKKFGLVGEIAVIDLDAAMGVGGNRLIIERLLKIARCRVGGGIRDYTTAKKLLDLGAEKIIIGTAASPAFLQKLPKDRLIVALDAVHDEVVIGGWQVKTGRGIAICMNELKGLVSGFLVTFVEREGRMQGTNLDRARELSDLAGSAKLTIAGGINTLEEIRELDRLGMDAQVGMAIYSGQMSLADAVSAPMQSDRSDGLWPTIVTDEHGVALGLAYSNLESLNVALERKLGVYHSRKRGLWVKGESSGNTQELIRVDLDCDRDTLRFMVRQKGQGFCHQDTWSCFGETGGLPALARTIAQRLHNPSEGSFTGRLANDSNFLGAKIFEEARELVDAYEHGHVVWEAADLIYFAMVKLLQSGGTLEEVERELNRRALLGGSRPK
jgi:phosphoribosyl-AMP cyclohydrolase / phosphoribosyl-ATP pyrophosphohydrolase